MRKDSNLNQPFVGVLMRPEQCKDCAFRRPDRNYTVKDCLKYKIMKPWGVMENKEKCKEYKKE
ncbi:hypothetical protein [Acidaminococcus provencensis]|jgi:hypothetical protein|uniref:hypothetical protein n=1 Tax=Acidaminococcus provencensis TaxID=2058289 RepID=UPI0022E6988B|nr:hypothetical protein [Acidaminococcus provencensis]